jgi:predicted Co/Zn/Cd cation transporter (cation efflux family)
MHSFLRIFFVFWIAAAALVVVALALAALKTIALIASASLYNALTPLIPGGSTMAWLVWGIVLGIVILPVFASCIVIVLGITRMLKGWPFRAARRDLPPAE